MIRLEQSVVEASGKKTLPDWSRFRTSQTDKRAVSKQKRNVY